LLEGVLNVRKRRTAVLQRLGHIQDRQCAHCTLNGVSGLYEFIRDQWLRLAWRNRLKSGFPAEYDKTVF